jgi:hypothetical protein
MKTITFCVLKSHCNAFKCGTESSGGFEKESANLTVPENEKEYPEYTMFGTLPAYGFYCRHVKNLAFDQIEFMLDKQDKRPAMVFDDVKYLNISNFDAQHLFYKSPIVVLKNVSTARIQSCPIARHNGPCVYVKGKHSENIILQDKYFSDNEQILLRDKNVPKNAIIKRP